jgi:hypothetical protein
VCEREREINSPFLNNIPVYVFLINQHFYNIQIHLYNKRINQHFYNIQMHFYNIRINQPFKNIRVLVFLINQHFVQDDAETISTTVFGGKHVSFCFKMILIVLIKQF